MKSKGNSRVCITFPYYLKKRLKETSEKWGCSQAEILRTGLIKMLEEK
jgi:predicted DNA-binding protein